MARRILAGATHALTAPECSRLHGKQIHEFVDGRLLEAALIRAQIEDLPATLGRKATREIVLELS
jgi:hypothetical protein